MSELWNTWMGKQTPAEVLRRADLAILAGKFESRREAFVDYVDHALRVLSPEAEPISPTSLAQRLLDYAEGSEQVGP
jgi:hypothetical protein